MDAASESGGQSSFDRVCAALVVVNPDIAGRRLGGYMSITDDLGVDSIRLVDLAFALRAVFGMEFYLMEWVDAEADKAGVRFTVDSLAQWCAACVRAERGGAGNGRV